MTSGLWDEYFSLEGRVAVVTGGSGVLGSTAARGLARAGARVAILGRDRARAKHVVATITAAGGAALALTADVLQPEQLLAARVALLERWGRLDILINAVGGNMPAATVPDEGSIFDLAPAAFAAVVDLNLLGVLLPNQVFGRAMIDSPPREGDGRPRGCIVNFSSMAAGRVLTRVAGYGAAKSAVENLTRWLAVELARKYGPGLRVNALAPGFFIGEQNRRLLLAPDGALTARGATIVRQTPAARFGAPDELVSTILWLCGPGAAFVNGVVVPVDGGFSAFSGV